MEINKNIDNDFIPGAELEVPVSDIDSNASEGSSSPGINDPSVMYKIDPIDLDIKPCNFILSCGHRCCGGVNNLNECSFPNHLCSECVIELQNENCAICIEALSGNPIFQLSCGHYFHIDCVKDMINAGNPVKHITFTFILCPLCRTLMDNHLLNEKIEPILKQRIILRNPVLNELEQYEKVGNSEHFKDKLDYALSVLTYYKCIKCNKPYFGGTNQCIEEEDDGESYICPICRVIGKKSCSIHGGENIVFKCRFCCSVAEHFCWGKCHFCSSCHKRQQQGEKLNERSKKVNKYFPVCKGREFCPLGIDHPYIEEFPIGCVVCLETAKKNQLKLE